MVLGMLREEVRRRYNPAGTLESVPVVGNLLKKITS